MKASLEKSEIVAILEGAERKAKMAAQIEVAKAMEEMDARFADKFVLLDKSMEEKQQKENVELKYTDSLISLNMEMQKHMEIARRLSGILVHAIPLLPEDHQAKAVAAVERAKSITTQDLQYILNSKITGTVPSMAHAYYRSKSGFPSDASSAADIPNNEQTDTLEGIFDRKKYLTNAEQKRLAKALALSEGQVKTWFQNRRAKWRCQLPPGSSDCQQTFPIASEDEEEDDE